MDFVAKVSHGEEPQKIDSSAENTTYVGYPQSGAADADAKWAIKKIAVAAGVTSVTWAGGSIEKKHKWTERAALQYSHI